MRLIASFFSALLLVSIALVPAARAQDTGISGDAGVETQRAVVQTVKTLSLKVPGVTSLVDVRFADVDGDAIFEGDISLGTTFEMGLLNALSGTDFSKFDSSEPQTEEPADSSDQLSADAVSAIGLRGLTVLANFGGKPRRWPGGRIPYVISAGFPHPERLTQAIQYWQSHTPLTFVDVTTRAGQFPNRVVFVAIGSGCSSPVGMQGGPQNIKLGPDCSSGNVVHELGHSIGLGHEQTRIDRDMFIRVDYANIIQMYQYNYDKHPNEYADSCKYDFDSIMHYPAKGSFNVDQQQPSLIPLQPLPAGVVMGQRDHLSKGDLYAVRQMYSSLYAGVQDPGCP